MFWMGVERHTCVRKISAISILSGYVSNLSPLLARANGYENFYSIMIRGYHSPEL